MAWHSRETGHLFVMPCHATLPLKIRPDWIWKWDCVWKEDQVKQCRGMAWHSMAGRLATSLSCMPCCATRNGNGQTHVAQDAERGGCYAVEAAERIGLQIVHRNCRIAQNWH